MMRYIPEATQSMIKPNYDYMGRRYTKKVTSNGTVSLHQRYIYRGYLQIACVDLTRSEHPALWYITWDPTEPVATRPLAIQKNATWYSYSHDLTKNVTELYQSDGLIATTYDYSPYGAVTAEGTEQSLQWSSEYHDAELALTYYNYRHYNPTDGRWINRDPIGEDGGFNLYGFIDNNTNIWIDSLGRGAQPICGGPSSGGGISIIEQQKAAIAAGKPLDHHLPKIQRSPIEDGFNACAQYDKIKKKPCCTKDGVGEDTYPQRAKLMCDSFVQKYSLNNTWTKPEIVCVAKCLVEEETQNQNEANCTKRNANRLTSHVGCYVKCMFILNPLLGNLGVPDGGWGIGFKELLPDFLLDSIPSAPTISF